mgnify:CR=1 FL=1
MTALRIVFMGTPDFAVPALRALRKAGHEIICVYTQPPRPKGRGQHVQPSPVQVYAETHNMPVRYPQSLKGSEAQHEFSLLEADVAIVAAYGLILPKAVLNAPKYGCINIHASLLPRWRGASPIQHAIWKGDAMSGITLMQMDEGLDTGAEISKETASIQKETTAQILHDQLSAIGGTMIVQAMETLARDGKLSSTAQNNALSNYAPLLKKEDGFINWTLSASEIDRQVRALNPWPGVSAGLEDARLKIQSAQVSDETTSAQAGTILDKSGHVACGGGTVLKLVKVQPANTKVMDFSAALSGNYIKVGDRLT